MLQIVVDKLSTMLSPPHNIVMVAVRGLQILNCVRCPRPTAMHALQRCIRGALLGLPRCAGATIGQLRTGGEDSDGDGVHLGARNWFNAWIIDELRCVAGVLALNCTSC